MSPSIGLSVAIIIPVINAESDWDLLHRGLEIQSLHASRILIVDSSSTDRTVELAKSAGYEVVTIARSDFNHGGTRQWAADRNPDVDILVYLTQDAVLASDDALQKLVAPFADSTIGAAFGRQLPKPGSKPLEAHARLFNYTDKSVVRTFELRKQLGFKAIFSSNSFAAYRRTALLDVGGFPTDVIVSEETVTFARMLQKGWKTVYAADAHAYHSHDYSVKEELQRCFDIGVLHTDQSWLLSTFGKVEGEGMRFVRSELKYLFPGKMYMLPIALLRIAMKVLGYRLGRNYRRLGSTLVRSLSQQKHYWRTR